MSSTKKTTGLLKIPAKTLPKDWREQGAKKFECSEATIEKIVYGQREDAQIFAYMLELAENETARKAEIKAELANRVKALKA
jgi:hypothetical protein